MNDFRNPNVNVLFVCLGNICRSPTAHGVFEGLVEDAGLGHLIRVDSAGTGDWHIGRSPDARMQQAAKLRGYDLSHLRARQVQPADFSAFDYIIAMDKQNLWDLEQMRPGDFGGHLGLFLEFGDRDDYVEVPDPYYGEHADFDLVIDLVEGAATGLLAHINQSRG